MNAGLYLRSVGWLLAGLAALLLLLIVFFGYELVVGVLGLLTRAVFELEDE